jgi:hypothetical protein
MACQARQGKTGPGQRKEKAPLLLSVFLLLKRLTTVSFLVLSSRFRPLLKTLVLSCNRAVVKLERKRMSQQVCPNKDKTRQDKTRQDQTRQDKTRQPQDKTRQDKTRQYNAIQYNTRQDKARQVKTRQDKTRPAKTRQDFHRSLTCSAGTRQRRIACVLAKGKLPLPCLILSCLVLSCLALSCLVLSCLVVPCPVLFSSCLVLSCVLL